jgi:medium-chain acyl-[acyl-carrier-protein] hydrolase
MTETSLWIKGHFGAQKPNLRLFCFPFAGGTAAGYRDWAFAFPASVQVLGVELPGRATRSMERPFVELKQLLGPLTNAIKPLLDRPFAFFGHSMGATIAFELVRHLRRVHRLSPQVLFVSARRAPQIPVEQVVYNLSESEFKAMIRRFEGTPAEVLEHLELMEVLIPLLRADFQLTQTYMYTVDDPLECPIRAYAGLQDREETGELMLPWRQQTSSDFGLRILPGNHFFLRSARNLLLQLLSRELQDAM